MFDFDLAVREWEFVFESPLVAVVNTPFARSFISGTMVGRQAEIIPADVSTTHQVCASAIVPVHMTVLGEDIWWVRMEGRRTWDVAHVNLEDQTEAVDTCENNTASITLAWL